MITHSRKKILTDKCSFIYYIFHPSFEDHATNDLTVFKLGSKQSGVF